MSVKLVQNEGRPLDERIADAIVAAPDSAGLASLLGEVRTADAAAQAAYEAAREAALDPATRPADVQAARQRMDDAQFRRSRFEVAVAKLTELHQRALQAEEEEARRRHRNEALAERDALATELAEFYPDMVSKLASLLERIQRNNAKVGEAQGAEAVARGAPDDWTVNPRWNMPSLLRGLRLPAFRIGDGFLWDGHAGGGPSRG